MGNTDEEKEPDFVDKGFAALDHALDMVHDKVMRPLFLAGRAVAFGFIIVLLTLVLSVSLLIALIRLFNVYVFSSHQWITYASIGAAFMLLGLLIWRKRRPVSSAK